MNWGVRYVLEGSVRKAGTRVRINAQLIEGSEGGHLWAERYDRSLEDIFAVQDEVTRETVGALRITLTPAEQASREHRGKVNPEAYDLVARAKTCLYQFTADSHREARANLERAIALDPDFEPAYALLSVNYSAEFLNNWNDASPDHLTKAVDLARQAMSLDENEPEAFHALGLSLVRSGKLDEAKQAIEQAIAFDPNFAGAMTLLGSLLDYQGHHEVAIETEQQALRLDPHYDIAMHFLGRAQFMLGRYEDAEATFRRRLIRMPRTDNSRAFLASTYGHLGRLDDAGRTWDELMEINLQFSVEYLRQALPYRDPSCIDRFVSDLTKAGLPV